MVGLFGVLGTLLSGFASFSRLGDVCVDVWIHTYVFGFAGAFFALVRRHGVPAFAHPLHGSWRSHFTYVRVSVIPVLVPMF